MLNKSAPQFTDPRRIHPMAMLRAMAGMVCAGVGFLGVLVPLLPTTPFLLMALWFFAGASPRLHNWLLTHPCVGPGLRAGQTHRAISRRAKLWAMVALAVTPIFSLAMGVPPLVLGVQAAILPLCALFILTRPRAPSQNSSTIRSEAYLQ